MWHLLHKNTLSIKSCVFKQRTHWGHTNLASHETLLILSFKFVNRFVLPIAIWNSKGKLLTLWSDSQTQASIFVENPLANHHLREARTSFFICVFSLALFHSGLVDMDTTCPPCVAVLCWDDSIVSVKPLAERTVLSIILVPPRTFHWSF